MISGFKASDIGQYGIGDLSWWEGDDALPIWGSAVPVPLGALFDIFNPWRDPPTRESVSGVYVQPSPTATGDSASEVTGDPEVLDETSTYVIDPDFRPEYTVYENAPGGIYETNRKPTDWDAYYDRYVILNEEEEMFHGTIDWGGWLQEATTLGQLGTAVGWWGGEQQAQPNLGPTGASAPNVLPAQQPGVTMATNGCPPTGPKYGKICLATGVVTPLRRRRRRRLLTSSDIKDLSALKSIVGGAALQGAVVQAVRR